MEIPITQNKEWQILQNDLKEESFFVKEKNYQYLAILKSTPVGNYLYLPYGPVYQDSSSFKHAYKSLKQLAERSNALFIRIEPLDENFTKYAPKNAIKSQDLNPKETWILDLKEKDITPKLPSRLLRYYKSAEKKGITIETSKDSKDIYYLLDLQKALAEKKGISTFSEKYLVTELAQPFATLYLVRYNNPEEDKQEKEPTKNIIAAGLVFDDKTTRYNLQGAQNDLGRKLHATGILTIKLILDAKEKGLKSFDFWGIAPENAPKNHPWAGFTNFKKTFDGYERDYAGTYDLVLKPFKYKLYQVTRKLNRIFKKI